MFKFTRKAKFYFLYQNLTQMLGLQQAPPAKRRRKAAPKPAPTHGLAEQELERRRNYFFAWKLQQSKKYPWAYAPRPTPCYRLVDYVQRTPNGILVVTKRLEPE